jgi:hypothetical protein
MCVNRRPGVFWLGGQPLPEDGRHGLIAWYALKACLNANDSDLSESHSILTRRCNACGKP